jgi:sulfur relay (sulfurtransferase) complex TusBCD TusD component (DsrE family)
MMSTSCAVLPLIAQFKKGGDLSNYVFIESRDPFDSPGTHSVSRTAVALRKEGHSVTVFLVENGVLGARKQAEKSQVPAIVESGVTVLADDFSLQKRGISMEECAPGLRTGTMAHLIELIVKENTKAVWY